MLFHHATIFSGIDDIAVTQNVWMALNFYISSCLCQHYRQFPKILSHDETTLTIDRRSGNSARLEDEKRDASKIHGDRRK